MYSTCFESAGILCSSEACARMSEESDNQCIQESLRSSARKQEWGEYVRCERLRMINSSFRDLSTPLPLPMWTDMNVYERVDIRKWDQSLRLWEVQGRLGRSASRHLASQPCMAWQPRENDSFIRGIKTMITSMRGWSNFRFSMRCNCRQEWDSLKMMDWSFTENKTIFKASKIALASAEKIDCHTAVWSAVGVLIWPLLQQLYYAAFEPSV